MIALSVALLVADAPREDAALRKLEIEATAAKGKQDAIEAAARMRQPACLRCRACAEPRAALPPPEVEQPATLPAQPESQPTSAPAPRQRMPVWAWVLIGGVAGTAMGAATVLAIWGATR